MITEFDKFEEHWEEEDSESTWSENDLRKGMMILVNYIYDLVDEVEIGDEEKFQIDKYIKKLSKTTYTKNDIKNGMMILLNSISELMDDDEVTDDAEKEMYNYLNNLK